MSFVTLIDPLTTAMTVVPVVAPLTGEVAVSSPRVLTSATVPLGALALTVASIPTGRIPAGAGILTGAGPLAVAVVHARRKRACRSLIGRLRARRFESA
jgi:hypothetical protein